MIPPKLHAKIDELAEKEHSIFNLFELGAQSMFAELEPLMKEMFESAYSFMSLEDDYQAEDTRGIHFAVQY